MEVVATRRAVAITAMVIAVTVAAVGIAVTTVATLRAWAALTFSISLGLRL